MCDLVFVPLAMAMEKGMVVVLPEGRVELVRRRRSKVQSRVRVRCWEGRSAQLSAKRRSNMAFVRMCGQQTVACITVCIKILLNPEE